MDDSAFGIVFLPSKHEDTTELHVHLWTHDISYWLMKYELWNKKCLYPSKESIVELNQLDSTILTSPRPGFQKKSMWKRVNFTYKFTFKFYEIDCSNEAYSDSDSCLNVLSCGIDRFQSIEWFKSYTKNVWKTKRCLLKLDTKIMRLETIYVMLKIRIRIYYCKWEIVHQISSRPSWAGPFHHGRGFYM